MKLYEIPRGSYIRLLEDASVPPAALQLNKGDLLYFDHVDGMYSFCRLGPEYKALVHPAAYTEAEVVDVIEFTAERRERGGDTSTG